MIREDIITKARISIQNNLQHRHYDRTIEHRKFNLQAITGEDTDELLAEFYRESEALHKQRQRFTVESVSSVTAPVLNKYYKVSRLPVREKLNQASQSATDIVKQIESNFWAESDVKNYLTQVIDDYQMFDPNAFLVIDFTPFNEADPTAPQKPVPFPIIYNCDEVWDFSYSRKGNLDYLFCSLEATIYGKPDIPTDKPNHVTVRDFYVYVEDYAYKFLEVHEHREDELRDIETNAASDATLDTKRLVFSTGKTYLVLERYVGSPTISKKQVQAMRIGYIVDRKARSIRVSPLHKAKSHLLDTHRYKSQYDLSMAQHVFPQLLMYGETCPGLQSEKPEWKCVYGKIDGTGQTCPTCKDSPTPGLIKPRSPQEYVLVTPPKDGEKQNAIPLRDWAYYLTTDIQVVQELKKELVDLRRQVFIAVFGVDLTTQTSGPDPVGGVPSATEFATRREGINDALLPFAQQRSELYKLIVWQSAYFFDIDAEVTFEYPKQLETESLVELLDKLAKYTAGNVSEILLDEVEIQIARLQFENDPYALKRFEVQRRFLPLRGKPDSVKSTLLSSPYIPTKYKVLYANFQWIFTQINQGQKGDVFYETMEFKDQLALVEEVLTPLVEQAKADEPTPPPNTLRRPTPPTNEPPKTDE